MSFIDDVARALNQIGERAAQQRAQRLAGWSHVAFEYGARFGGSTSAGMHLERDGVALHVDTHTSTSRSASGSTSTKRSTRFRAPFALGGGPRFTVTRDGGGAFAEGLRSIFSIEDAHLGGHEAFDRAFLVQTKELAWTRQAWTKRARDLRLSCPGGSVRADGRTVTFRRSGHLYAVDDLRLGIELVHELAGVNVEWLETLRAHLGPDARVVPASGFWNARRPPSIQVAPASPVYVFPVRVFEGMGVAAVCGPGRELPFFDTRFANGRTERALREDVLVGRGAELLRAAGTGRLYYFGEQVEVTIEGTIDAERLRAACDLAERIALGGGPPPTSAYR